MFDIFRTFSAFLLLMRIFFCKRQMSFTLDDFYCCDATQIADSVNKSLIILFILNIFECVLHVVANIGP